MNIAVIGGGFTGLTTAYELSKYGHRITLFEKEKFLGGLAYGFQEKHWDWHLEGAYHHLFTNDAAILKLTRELGVSTIIKRPITATLWSGGAGSRSARKNRMYQLDSPYHLLTFPGLPFVDKIRTGVALGFLKTFPFWKLLEGITAEHYLVSIGGKQAWKTIWEPLLYGKFGNFAPTVSLAWFWARIVKRTPKLCYIKEGFHTLVAALHKAIVANGGKIVTSTTVTAIKKGNGKSYIVYREKQKDFFNSILLTIPTPFALSLLPKYDIQNPIYDALRTIPHLHAQTLILETDKPILKDVYWLNVTDRSFPFLAAVAHTNFMNTKHYGGKHITYFGNYLPQGHPYLSMTKKQLLNEFLPYINRLCPSVNYKLITYYSFVGPFAQPVHQLHYSRKIPPIQTPLPGVYLANMDYVVPWDRGTNYAVELGVRAARIINHETK